MDLNFVMLQGRIGNDLQYRKTKDGATFATFTIIINSYNKELKDRTEQRNDTYIRIMAFDKRIVEYMQNCNAKQGNRVNVVARLNSHKSEYKGVALVQIDVVARDVVVIKAKDEGAITNIGNSDNNAQTAVQDNAPQAQEQGNTGYAPPF